MASSTFREQGFPIGSGAVESAAGHLVQQHTQVAAAMRWSAAGGAALLVLLADDAGGRRLDHLIPRAWREVA